MAINTPHIVAMPGWLLIFRILQITLSVGILGIASYMTWAVVGLLPGFSLALFTAIATLIIVTYILVATQRCPTAYNYWAILALEIFALIFWLCTMAVLASYISAVRIFVANYGYYYYESSCTIYSYSWCSKKRAVRTLTKRMDFEYQLFYGLTGGATGIAALELIFFVVTLITFSVFMHRHRKSSAPNHPPGSYGMNNFGSEPKQPQAQVHVQEQV